MTYPAHIRQKILSDLETSTYKEVAARHKISPNTLARWKKQPTPKPKSEYKDKARKLTEEKLRQDVADYPDAYQWERAARLGSTQHAVSKAMKRYKLTRKKNSTAPKS
ncbi:IS630 transposase-related protein [Bergeriella denitrificans]|uniref:Transposase n=1 Tax=Bergeriella denitrificans TaxID=494 RepID=A0A378UI97_BERDE|nr:IS630 transposase-related protein [Bergeriella denitrificans]STZ75930.1 Transposase [Bergeriella denitrificans]STZ76221.1 Transposase [Bergeriella denitrificans]